MTVPDVMINDADRHAEEEGRKAAEQAWIEARVEQILADDDDLDLALELYASFDTYELEREVAIQAARAGATPEAERLAKLLRGAAEVMAAREMRVRD